jgi:tRNA (guanine-N7-)-methyltransferase
VSGQVHYVFTNVSVSLARLLEAYPGPVSSLAAQFPDPHFKKRHKKRRMVQQSVVQAARELLVPGGKWLACLVWSVRVLLLWFVQVVWRLLLQRY